MKRKIILFGNLFAMLVAISISCNEYDNPVENPSDKLDSISPKSTTVRYKVYSPFNGTQWGQTYYCNGTRHKTGITNLCCPTDLHAPVNTQVKFICSSNIKSIKTIKTGPAGNGNDGDALCYTAPPSAFSWVNEGVKVELYTEYNGQGYIGTVFYGHLKNRIFNGVYNNPNGLQIGQLGNADCNCGCYDGIHTHMERSPNGSTVSRSCDISITTSSLIYYFDLDYVPY